MITEAQRANLRKAFQAGTLKIRSVSPEGAVVWKRVLEVFRNEVPWERIKAVTTIYGTKVLTGGHKIYVSPTDRVAVEDLRPGDHVVSVVGESLLYVPILEIRDLPPRRYMYDLTADTWANFVSTRILIKNSPDKFYHFRPPEHEARIGAYDRVFGQIWEDAELYEYLQRGLDWWNMFPPSTFSLSCLPLLYNQMPAWRTAVYWAAITHALFAVSLNWIADEFSMSSATLFRLYLPDNSVVHVTAEELYDICHGPAA